MSCIPHSGGCERPATDALVNHVNWLEGTHYEHQACLDQIDRTQPQPECLYVDAYDGRTLVIKRKSISGPESYPHHRSKDHALADAIHAGLAGLEFPDLYSLAMPSVPNESKAELTEAGRFVAEQIRNGYAGLRREQSLHIKCLGHSFSFQIRPFEDRDDDEPDNGLVNKGE